MTAHEEHGFPDPTFESIFCGSSFDPSLKADTTPTFLCKFLLGFSGTGRGESKKKAQLLLAQCGRVLYPSARVCVTGPLQDACTAASNKGHDCGIVAFFRTADHSQEHTRWNQPVTAYVQDLCLRLWCGSSASFSGTKAHSD